MENTLLKLSSLLGMSRAKALQHARNARRAGDDAKARECAIRAARYHEMSRKAYRMAYGRV